MVEARLLEGPTHGRHDGRPTLVHRFGFPGAKAAAVQTALWERPLIGNASVFGAAKGARAADGPGFRGIDGFSPAPGFRFDVRMRRPSDTSFLVTLSQPSRPRPYLDGELAWWVTEGDDGAEWLEHINTERALRLVDRPLAGSAWSFRRWMFFRVGHAQVMKQVASNLSSILS